MGEGPVKGIRAGRSRRRWRRPYTAALAAGALAFGGVASATVASAGTSGAGAAGSATAYRTVAGNTTTPIKHVVVIFQENVSFDHYFGTYPKAANTSGQPFRAPRDTPTVNNLADTHGRGRQGHPADQQPEHGRQRQPGQPAPPATRPTSTTC